MAVKDKHAELRRRLGLPWAKADYSLKASCGFRTKESVQCACEGGRWCTRENPDKNKSGNPIPGLHCSWVGSDTLAMARPWQCNILQYNIVEAFKKANIGMILNVQEVGEHDGCGPGNLPHTGFSYDPESFTAAGISYFNMGWIDMGVPGLNLMLNIVQVMAFVLGNGQRVAVHCHAGLGRTGLAIACSFVFNKMYDADTAIETVRKYRRGALQTKAQVMFVSVFQQYLAHHRCLFERAPAVHLSHLYEASDRRNATMTAHPVQQITAPTLPVPTMTNMVAPAEVKDSSGVRTETYHSGLTIVKPLYPSTKAAGDASGSKQTRANSEDSDEDNSSKWAVSALGFGHQMYPWDEKFRIDKKKYNANWTPAPAQTYPDALERQQQVLHGRERRIYLHLHLFLKHAVFAIIAAAEAFEAHLKTAAAASQTQQAYSVEQLPDARDMQETTPMTQQQMEAIDYAQGYVNGYAQGQAQQQLLILQQQQQQQMVNQMPPSYDTRTYLAMPPQQQQQQMVNQMPPSYDTTAYQSMPPQQQQQLSFIPAPSLPGSMQALPDFYQHMHPPPPMAPSTSAPQAVAESSALLPAPGTPTVSTQAASNIRHSIPWASAEQPRRTPTKVESAASRMAVPAAVSVGATQNRWATDVPSQQAVPSAWSRPVAEGVNVCAVGGEEQEQEEPCTCGFYGEEEDTFCAASTAASMQHKKASDMRPGKQACGWWVRLAWGRQGHRMAPATCSCSTAGHQSGQAVAESRVVPYPIQVPHQTGRPGAAAESTVWPHLANQHQGPSGQRAPQAVAENKLSAGNVPLSAGYHYHMGPPATQNLTAERASCTLIRPPKPPPASFAHALAECLEWRRTGSNPALLDQYSSHVAFSGFVGQLTTPDRVMAEVQAQKVYANFHEFGGLSALPVLPLLILIENFFNSMDESVPILSTQALALIAEVYEMLPFELSAGPEQPLFAWCVDVLERLPPADQELLLLFSSLMRHVARASKHSACEEHIKDLGEWIAVLLLGLKVASHGTAEEAMMCFLWWLLRNDIAYASLILIKQHRGKQQEGLAGPGVLAGAGWASLGINRASILKPHPYATPGCPDYGAAPDMAGVANADAASSAGRVLERSVMSPYPQDVKYIPVANDQGGALPAKSRLPPIGHYKSNGHADGAKSTTAADHTGRARGLYHSADRKRALPPLFHVMRADQQQSRSIPTRSQLLATAAPSIVIPQDMAAGISVHNVWL